MKGGGSDTLSESLNIFAGLFKMEVVEYVVEVSNLWKN